MYIKKYVRNMFVIYILSILIFGSVEAHNSLNGKSIYIDPGHGGIDPGAVYSGLMEDDINLVIAKKLKKELESYGAKVYMTREGDYDLSLKGAKNRKRSDLYRRSKLINESGCDIYLSLHLNAVKQTKWSGAQVFYDSINSSNINIAKVMQEELKKEFKTTRKYSKITNGYLYKRVKIPGILIEMGFISNKLDRSNLINEKYQELMAKTIRRGLVRYFTKYQ